MWGTQPLFSEKERAREIGYLKSLKHYQLKAVYDCDINTTVGQIKEQLLFTLFEKLAYHDKILANLLFFNRIDEQTISLELFIFCQYEMNDDELDDLTVAKTRILTDKLAIEADLNYEY